MIELPRSHSKETRILMTSVEPVENGARARLRVVVEEVFELEDSYETVQEWLRDKPEHALKLTN